MTAPINPLSGEPMKKGHHSFTPFPETGKHPVKPVIPQAQLSGPTDPAALARELAEQIEREFLYTEWVEEHREDGTVGGRIRPYLDLESTEQLLIATLERLARERDKATSDIERPFRVTAALHKVLAEAGCISVNKKQYDDLRAQLATAKAERHDLQMRAERAEAILRKAGRALTGGKHVTYEDLDEYLRTVEKERDEAVKQSKHAWDRHAEKDRAYGVALKQRDAAQTAEREARALLGECLEVLESADNLLQRCDAMRHVHGGKHDYLWTNLSNAANSYRSKTPHAYSGAVENRIHAHLARGGGGT